MERLSHRLLKGFFHYCSTSFITKCQQQQQINNRRCCYDDDDDDDYYYYFLQFLFN